MYTVISTTGDRTNDHIVIQFTTLTLFLSGHLSQNWTLLSLYIFGDLTRCTFNETTASQVYVFSYNIYTVQSRINVNAGRIGQLPITHQP